MKKNLKSNKDEAKEDIKNKDQVEEQEQEEEEEVTTASVLKDEALKMSEIYKKVLKEKPDLVKNNSKQDQLVKMMTLMRLFSTMKTLKEDNLPIEIIDNLYIGSLGAASNKKGLKENGITHIITAACQIKSYFPKDFTYVQYELLDSEKQDIKQYFKDSGEFIDNAIKNGGKVLVHCSAGVSRSATIILAYLIKYKKMNFDDAFALVKKKREKLAPNSGFINQLKEYENECLGKVEDDNKKEKDE